MEISEVIRKILPRIFLKRVAGIYRSLRNSTIDRFLFPEFILRPDQFEIYRNGYPFKENKVAIQGIANLLVRSYMEDWYNWTQEEFLLIFKTTCYIEPGHGWAIIPPNKLLYYSLGISRTWFQAKPDFYRWLTRPKPIQLGQVISLRDSGEENYFHFYNDVLTKIFFLKANAIDVARLPVVISKKLWDKSYFQYYLQKSEEFRSLNWVVQDSGYLCCQSVIFCKPLTHRIDLFKSVFAPLYLAATGDRKIFIIRNRDRMRYIENQDMLNEILKAAEFEIVDTALLSSKDQIELFSSAGVVAGIHGAGLTNIFFRNGPCRILEIFPPPESDYLPFHYLMIASMKGFSYNAIVGEKGRESFSAGFYVDPDVLKQALKLLVNR